MGRKTLANGDVQDSSIGHNPEWPQRETGWLTREVRDQLDAAGYYAVPKESVRIIYSEELVDYWAQMRFGKDPEFLAHVNRRLAQTVGMQLLKEGFLQLHLFEPDDMGVVRHRVEATVFQPRTIPIVK